MRASQPPKSTKYVYRLLQDDGLPYGIIMIPFSVQVPAVKKAWRDAIECTNSYNEAADWLQSKFPEWLIVDSKVILSRAAAKNNPADEQEGSPPSGDPDEPYKN